MAHGPWGGTHPAASGLLLTVAMGLPYQIFVLISGVGLLLWSPSSQLSYRKPTQVQLV